MDFFFLINFNFKNNLNSLKTGSKTKKIEKK